ncbi:aminopeptidase [soil metagenome]
MTGRAMHRLTRTRALLLLALALLMSGCNPFYVARAGVAQARILASREPLHEVIVDPATDRRTSGKLTLVLEAREFAISGLGFENAGNAYTSLARLPSDTLALVLSAAYRDRLAFRTWWFPITGHVPYRAYFSEAGAIAARDRLEAEGFDTYLRPTAAFSTLGWFADPLYSTLLRLDEVGLVETVLHELAHNHLFLPGQGRFNESWATFAGNAGAIEFFCRRPGGGPDTTWCRRARDRWADAIDISAYLDDLEFSIRSIYAREELEAPAKIALRDEVYEAALSRFRNEVQPGLRATTYAYLASEELNNATLLARTLYFHRLGDFQALLDAEGGDLRRIMARLRAEAPDQSDPFGLLPGGAPTGLSDRGSR